MVFAAWWPLPRSTPRRRRRERTAARARRLLQVLVVAIACAALSLELAVRWAFQGAAQSWAGRSASLAVTVVDIVVVLGGQVAVGAQPPRLIAVACLAAAAGVLVSLLAAGLSAAWGRAHRLAD